jgi:hypothetical protein
MPRTQNVTGQDVSGSFPEFWSASLQVPLYKSLVALEVASTDLQKELQIGDTLHKNYFGDLASEAYSPGTPVSAKVMDFTDDYITVDTKRDVAIYVDNIDQLQSNLPSIGGAMAEEMAYRLKDDIDQAVFAAGNLDRGTLMRGEHIAGGASGHSITATTANIIDIFSKARQKLRENHVTEGDWIAVICADTMELIESKATGVGYNVADSTLRNGYAGEFMGFKLYLSENLPTSTVVSAGGGETAAYCRHHYFGKRGMIDLVMQQSPSMVIKDVSDKLGKNFIAYTLYGTKVFHKNQDRFLDVRMHKV